MRHINVFMVMFLRTEQHLWNNEYGILDLPAWEAILRVTHGECGLTGVELMKRLILSGANLDEIYREFGLRSWTTSVSRLYAQAKVELRQALLAKAQSILFDRRLVSFENRNYTIPEVAELMSWPDVLLFHKPVGKTFFDFLFLDGDVAIRRNIQRLLNRVVVLTDTQARHVLGLKIKRSREAKWEMKHRLFEVFDFGSFERIYHQHRVYPVYQLAEMIKLADALGKKIEYHRIKHEFETVVWGYLE